MYNIGYIIDLNIKISSEIYNFKVDESCFHIQKNRMKQQNSEGRLWDSHGCLF